MIHSFGVILVVTTLGILEEVIICYVPTVFMASKHEHL
jgi:hypothetical protein